jgi:Asp-tRNA(Asn)/Glu-tRNA(Gln) amidotransferase A subunit family amidase
LPIGLHVVGKMFDDRTVLRASRAYEAATAWGEKKPKL